MGGGVAIGEGAIQLRKIVKELRKIVKNCTKKKLRYFTQFLPKSKYFPQNQNLLPKLKSDFLNLVKMLILVKLLLKKIAKMRKIAENC